VRKDLCALDAEHIPCELMDNKMNHREEMVLFVTYAKLAQSQDSLEKLVTLAGGDNFEGCLVLDECHRAKNFSANVDKASTVTGKRVVELQSRLPNARVIYSSATMCSEAKHVAYMTRLGLWGNANEYRTFLGRRNTDNILLM